MRSNSAFTAYGNRGKLDALKNRLWKTHGKPYGKLMEKSVNPSSFKIHYITLFLLSKKTGLFHNLPTVLPTGFPQPLLRASNEFPTVPTGETTVIAMIDDFMDGYREKEKYLLSQQ